MSGLTSLFMVCIIVLGGIFFYLFRMDVKLSRLEKHDS